MISNNPFKPTPHRGIGHVRAALACICEPAAWRLNSCVERSLEKKGSQIFKSIALVIALAILPTANAQNTTLQPHHGIKITSVKLGSHVNSDLTVPVPKNIFKPIETIHLSVATNASGDAPVNGSIGVLWTFGEGTDLQAVQDDSRELEFQGDGITVFEISKPDPWPEGRYHAEIFLDGESVHKIGFIVR